MKINKELAKDIWLFYGERIVGSVLCVAGFVMACKGARNYGGVYAITNLQLAAPEEFDKLADKILS